MTRLAGFPRHGDVSTVNHGGGGGGSGGGGRSCGCGGGLAIRKCCWVGLVAVKEYK